MENLIHKLPNFVCNRLAKSEKNNNNVKSSKIKKHFSYSGLNKINRNILTNQLTEVWTFICMTDNKQETLYVWFVLILLCQQRKFWNVTKIELKLNIVHWISIKVTALFRSYMDSYIQIYPSKRLIIILKVIKLNWLYETLSTFQNFIIHIKINGKMTVRSVFWFLLIPNFFWHCHSSYALAKYKELNFPK